MSVTADQAFTKQYESEVHHAYQQRGSKLRPSVRHKNNIKGSSTTFQKVGKGEATTKARHGIVTPMNVDHSPVECSLADYYAGDWVDRLDEAKQEHDERRVLINAGAYALGRKTDELIISALDQTTTTVVDGGTGMGKTKVLEAFETLGTNDVFEEGRMYAVVGWKQWTELLEISEFANADFIGGEELPWLHGTEARRWLGTIWIPHSGLTKAGTVRQCHWYHEDSIGHASGEKVKSDISWHGDRAAHFVVNMMSQGACLIDASGVVQIDCDEAA